MLINNSKFFTKVNNKLRVKDPVRTDMPQPKPICFDSMRVRLVSSPDWEKKSHN